jgi:hypothetical protein
MSVTGSACDVGGDDVGRAPVQAAAGALRVTHSTRHAHLNMISTWKYASSACALMPPTRPGSPASGSPRWAGAARGRRKTRSASSRRRAARRMASLPAQGPARRARPVGRAAHWGAVFRHLPSAPRGRARPVADLARVPGPCHQEGSQRDPGRRARDSSPRVSIEPFHPACGPPVLAASAAPWFWPHPNPCARTTTDAPGRLGIRTRFLLPRRRMPGRTRYRRARRDRVARRPPRGRRSVPGLPAYTDGHGMPHQ